MALPFLNVGHRHHRNDRTESIKWTSLHLGGNLLLYQMGRGRFIRQCYRTSIRTSTGATPFSLVYGMEVVLPIEVEIPSLRVLMEAKLEELKWVQTRFGHLNLIEEKRLAILCHGQLSQKRLKKAYEKKIRPREFREGDLVLKKIIPIQKDYRGKWTPN
ncbi:uncharacterized protein [Cicer arietinum]|uniref:uncharacterized protein n=1 Tax=Cicer arietinum TaxID=3827 RepID=UPI00032A9ADB